MKEAVIVGAVRTAIGRAVKGTLKDTRPDDMCAETIKEVMRRTPQVAPEEIEDLVVGCATPEASQGMNVGRIIGIDAGLPHSVPAATLNRFCSSGLNAIAMAGKGVMCGFIDVALAGGVESMSMVPMGGFNTSINPRLIDACPDVYMPMGMTAENVAQQFNIAREDQDRFAYESHTKAVKAIREGKFKAQIVPLDVKVNVPGPDGNMVEKEVRFDTDECPRADTSLEKLSTLRPSFSTDGSVTPGNSSPLNDGASMTMVMGADVARAKGLKPMARFRHFAVAGVPPGIMGVGPIYAIGKLFQKTGLKADDIDLYELNEAFASQALHCVRELKLPIDRVNVNGGAIALGHPLGCTGAYITTKLLYEMEARDARWGVVSMCVGGGMGAAGLFERVKG